MKTIRLAATAACFALAACSSSPAGPAAVTADRPSFDGGNGMGSGNYVADDGGGVLSDTTASDLERGGNGMGSGN